MTKIYVSLIVALSIVYLNPSNITFGLTREQEPLEAIGTVVAYDQLISLTNITSAPKSQVLIVRIARRIKGPKNRSYIKVIYKYAANESPLPQNMFDGNNQWRFILTRDFRCDSTLREMKPIVTTQGQAIPRLKFTREKDLIQDGVSLPCYVLKPGQYRMQE